jgi:hypothetical protein
MATNQRELPAMLWSAPVGDWPAPPVHSKPAVLPVGELSWENTERLFTRLLDTEAHVEQATLYGLRGQFQAGIDVYARTTPDLGSEHVSEKGLVALQSRRVRKLSPSMIASAVTEFLAGDWVDRCTRFYYATSASLHDTKLDDAVRSATDRLAEVGIMFVPWGIEEVSERLRDHPRLVDDFFGRPWVALFCGEDRIAELGRRMQPEKARAAREALGTVYRAAFQAQGASSTVTRMHTDALPYIILDTQPIATGAPGRAITSAQQPDQSTEFEVQDEYGGAERLLGRREPRTRPVKPSRSAEAGGARTPVDEWAESARLRLLVGAPGSGKSSFLMFAAADILSPEPQSAALQRAHGGDLPLWLPFGFLCRHLAESTSHSIVSAIQAWVTQQAGETTWDLTRPALEDERAVLLVDGIDEWSDAATAEYALGLVESFVSQRSIGAILTTRPYALDKLNWVLAWVKVALAPLTATQQLDLVHRTLTESGGAAAEGLPNPHATTFLAELGRVPSLEPLLATPLFLTVLAKSWRGESLPPQRFQLYSALVHLLVDRHPQMRRRASSAGGSEFSISEMLTVLRGVAYQTRLEGSSAISSRTDMERRFRDELRSEDGLAYPAKDAARVAAAVLAQAEDEFGILVPQGIGMVGFLHRVLLDQLAGEHLATLPPDVFEEVLGNRAGDPTWRDVLIAGLASQVNAYVNTTLLSGLTGRPTIDPVDKYELIAEAIAAGVTITASKQTMWVSDIIDRVQEHPDSAHGITLIDFLVSMTKHATLRPRLLATFRRWLSASHPEPTSALWALRDHAVDESRVLPVLLWGLRHEDETVQLNAAHAIATRYSGDVEVGRQVAAVVRDGAIAIDQAFALLCLGTGWPHWPELSRFLEWARAQVTPELRVCALHLLREAHDGQFDDLTPAERRWFGTSLDHEELRPHEHWRTLAVPFVQQVFADKPAAASYVLEILAGNGRNGGNRATAWLLACTTFSDDTAIKEWVASELANPDRHGLILYNLFLIPDSWRQDPAFALSAAATVREDTANPSFRNGAIDLSEALPDDEALEALLPGLDGFRPVRAASALLKRFGHLPRVQEEFRARLTGPTKTAAPLAPLAVEALGASTGFEILVTRLRSDPADRPDDENRVVVAMAVADAWLDFAQNPDDEDVAAVMSRYDPDELATLCAAVGTRHLTWHVASTIAAWPENPSVVKFAMNALQHPRHLTSGIHDPAPPAIIRTYGSRGDATANTLMDAVLDQLAYLPPHLRETLVDALTRSDLTPTALLELLHDWNDDPDVWVQRSALTGLIGRVDRFRISANADSAQIDMAMDWLRDQVRAELCGYGPEHEEHRQTAWIAMLLLDDFTLHDGLLETIGEPTIPGTRLYHLFGDVDLELIELINARWNDVHSHFGDGIFTLLTSARTKDVEAADARSEVLRHLSHAQFTHPGLNELIQAEAETHAAFRASPEYLRWSHRNGRRDLDLYVACLEVEQSRHSRTGINELHGLLVDSEAWDITLETLQTTISEQPEFESHPMLRALFCELSPEDQRSQQMLTDLESWFQSGRPRERREWVDTLAIAIRCSPATALPIVVDRAHRRLRDAPELLPLLTAPLQRRLRGDTDAASTMQAVILLQSSADTSTPIWANSTEEEESPTALARRAFVLACALQRSGLLDEQTATVVQDSLTSGEAGDTIAFDPVTGIERSLRALAGRLTRPRTTPPISPA